MSLSLAVPGTLEQAEAFLIRAGIEKDRDQLEAALRAAAEWMESPQATGRRLVERTYRDPVSVTGCVVTVNSKSVTGGDFTNVKRSDAVTGAGIAPGTRVDATGATITLSQAATASGNPVTLSFGSAPLLVSGTGKSTIYVPERPLTEIYAVRKIEADGTETALDITSHRIDSEIGLLRLPYDVFPRGTSNIEIDCRAGYREPTATDLGHPEWHSLQRACFRLAQCYFQDQANALGRVADKTLGQAAFRFVDFDVPKDILLTIAPFVRREGV